MTCDCQKKAAPNETAKYILTKQFKALKEPL